MTPSPGTSICHGCDPKKDRKKYIIKNIPLFYLFIFLASLGEHKRIITLKCSLVDFDNSICQCGFWLHNMQLLPKWKYKAPHGPEKFSWVLLTILASVSDQWWMLMINLFYPSNIICMESYIKYVDFCIWFLSLSIMLLTSVDFVEYLSIHSFSLLSCISVYGCAIVYSLTRWWNLLFLLVFDFL